MAHKIFAAVVLLLFGAAEKWLLAEQLRTNVVFILADDLGYGDLSCYGCPDIRTPRLDQLAAEGVRFTDAYANGPVCSPTRYAFMTGRYQQRGGLERPHAVKSRYARPVCCRAG